MRRPLVSLVAVALLLRLDQQGQGRLQRRGDPRNSIETAADLAGKQVAVNTLKNIGDSTIRASARGAGGDPSSIKFTELPFRHAGGAGGRPGGRGLGGGAVPVGHPRPGRPPGRLELRRHRPRPHRGRLPHLREAPAGRPRPGQAVHRGHERVAGLRRRPSRRGPPGPHHLHPDRQGRDPGPDPARWPAEINRESVETLANLAVQDGLVPDRYLPPSSRIAVALADELGRPECWAALGDTLEGWAIGLALAVGPGSRWGCCWAASPPCGPPPARPSSSCAPSTRSP